MLSTAAPVALAALSGAKASRLAQNFCNSNTSPLAAHSHQVAIDTTSRPPETTQLPSDLNLNIL